MPNFGALSDLFGAVKSFINGFVGLTGSLAGGPDSWTEALGSAAAE